MDNPIDPHTATNRAIFERLTPEQQAQALATVAAQRPGVNGHGPGEALPSWQVRTLADAYKPRKPLRYLVANFLPEGAFAMAFGVPGGFKSFSMADLAVCVASGRNWLTMPDGAGGLATTAVPVFWLDCDNGRRRTDMRFDALGKARGLPADTPLFYVSMPHPALNLADDSSAMMLTDYTRQYGAGLVVVDNLGLITGDVEENASGMAAVMGNLRRLIEDTGAAVLLLHHQRKTADKEQQMNVIRGHSSIAASLDMAVHISRDRAESRTSATIIPVKNRDAEIPLTGLDFSFENDPVTGELLAARFFGRAIADTSSKQAIRQAILVALYGGVQINQGDLLEAVKGQGITAGVNAVRGEIADMEKLGELMLNKGERGAKLYFLA